MRANTMQKSLRTTLFCLLAAICMPVLAGSMTVSWKAPTQRTDKTVLAVTEIASYTVRSNGAIIDTVAGTVNSTKYTPGKGACIAKGALITTAVTDTGNLSSADSTAVSLSADVCGPKYPPNAPDGVSVVVGE